MSANHTHLSLYFPHPNVTRWVRGIYPLVILFLILTFGFFLVWVWWLVSRLGRDTFVSSSVDVSLLVRCVVACLGIVVGTGELTCHVDGRTRTWQFRRHVDGRTRTGQLTRHWMVARAQGS